MSAELLNSRDRLQFAAPFRSLMTACEVGGRSEERGAEAFEIRQEHMLPWLERNGPETARTVESELASLISRLEKRPRGTVWSDEFDFNHRWPVADAISYFENWRKELAEANQLHDAKSIVLLSLLARFDQAYSIEKAQTGDYFFMDLSEREFAVLARHDAVFSNGHWVFVFAINRSNDDSRALLCRPAFRCSTCNSEVEIHRDADDTSDLWRIACCDAEAWGHTISELTKNWASPQFTMQTLSHHD